MKKGFTLIELMVVIVIIGILAAIAVPKMFGMSAKAKAAEVGPAVGSWSKIQAAYITETGASGSWMNIAYIAPGLAASADWSQTTNFNYQDGAAATAVAGAAGSTSVSGMWAAANRNALNPCIANQAWTATYGNTAAAPLAAGAGATAGNACAALTPNFAKIQ